MNAYRVLHVSIAAIFLTVLFAGIRTAHATVYVSLSGDNTTGSSWATAYHDVQTAVNAAGVGEDVWVAAGTYPLAAAVTLPSGVAVYGGFAAGAAVLSEQDPEQFVTTLDGQSVAGNLIVCDNVTDVRVDGLRLTGGTGGGTGYTQGGALVCRGASSSVIIADCLIEGNHVNGFGGGINVSNSSASVENSRFDTNSSTSGAGGLNVYVAQVEVTGSTFTNNAGGGDGGGIGTYNSSLTVDRCVFAENTAPGGAGIHCGSGATAHISNSLFAGNTVTVNHGGGIAFWRQTNTSVSHCTFVDNVAITGGGGILYFDCNGTIDSSIFVNNTKHAVYNHESATDPQFMYCLFLNNPDGLFYATVGSILNIDALNALALSNDNVEGAPRFVSPNLGDYHIHADSDARNTGQELPMPHIPSYDIDGEPRYDILPDIGFDEYLDTDGDSLPDYWESLHGLNPFFAGGSDRDGDLDGDSLTNAEEFGLGTDPENKDSDGDGIEDNVEVLFGMDPTVATPGVTVPATHSAGAALLVLLLGLALWKAGRAPRAMAEGAS
jgi:hypothetical protein